LVGTGSPGKIKSVVGERAVQTGSELTKGIARQRKLTGDDIESSYRLTPADRPVVDH